MATEMEWGIQFFQKINSDSGSGTSSKNQTQFHFAFYWNRTSCSNQCWVVLALYEEPPIPVL
jgi:hypothetical protein